MSKASIRANVFMELNSLVNDIHAVERNCRIGKVYPSLIKFKKADLEDFFKKDIELLSITIGKEIEKQAKETN